MLDITTKRRIDSLRDILVGKVPDPKSQVEQITIALIYKFMDDMDAEAEELGGKRKFFAGEFRKYSWPKLMRSGLGGNETLNLYAEAIAKMPQNPGIPPLFREIFKNAYLPYRDPETLKSFLKIIDQFDYDHSEKLGDAYEHLLQVLGSQGDAGQFRTPRNIIDFIVDVVDPQKHETILDPACGTAGFLISAYKHIRAANTDADGNSTLVPDERRRLAENVKGYDISPDMVRLSLVNLYLHGFTAPNIFEYDTLTTETRWGETADVIFANPPFMSPKGGIKPHRRFSIQAKRSEVLFVDYIAEHLNPQGRAGIIVPEGIIFQSQTSYVALRKLLVENSLVAVISLPAGVFNPYSGVKTSILILDKLLAKQSTSVGFFKIENDGFGLGAQRREIEKNDLPKVKTEIEIYLNSLRNHQSMDELEFTTGQIVAKEKISVNGNYNLSGERYRDDVIQSSNYPMVPIGEICELVNGRAFKPEDWKKAEDGGLPIIRIQNLNNPDSEFNYYNGEVRDRFIVETGDLLFSWSGSRGTSFGAHIWKGEKAILNQHIFNVHFSETRTLKMYLLEALNKAVAEVEENLHGGVGLVHITKGNLEKIEIPLPSLDVQLEIVAEIEGYQKIITGARAVLDNYCPYIPNNPEWPRSRLADVCESILTGPFGSALHQSDYVKAGIPVINPQNISEGTVDIEGIKQVTPQTRDGLKEFTVREHDIIIGRRGEMGRCAVISDTMNGWLCGTGCFVIRLKKSGDVRYVYHQLTSSTVKEYLERNAIGVTLKNLNQRILSDISIPLPPLTTQQAIVTEIEAEQTLVAANRELIARFEKKIQATLARVWGE